MSSAYRQRRQLCTAVATSGPTAPFGARLARPHLDDAIAALQKQSVRACRIAGIPVLYEAVRRSEPTPSNYTTLLKSTCLPPSLSTLVLGGGSHLLSPCADFPVRDGHGTLMHSQSSTFWATTGNFPQELVITFDSIVQLSAIDTRTLNGT